QQQSTSDNTQRGRWDGRPPFLFPLEMTCLWKRGHCGAPLLRKNGKAVIPMRLVLVPLGTTYLWKRGHSQAPLCSPARDDLSMEKRSLRFASFSPVRDDLSMEKRSFRCASFSPVRDDLSIANRPFVLT